MTWRLYRKNRQICRNLVYYINKVLQFIEIKELICNFSCQMADFPSFVS